MTIRQVLTLFRKSAVSWNEDDCASMGAAIAYYTLFSVAPLLVIVISLAGLIFGREAAQGQILNQVRDLIGPTGAQAVEGILKHAQSKSISGVGAVLGVLMLVIGATTIFAELHGDLNRIWRSPSPPKASGIWNLIRTRILSFGMILCIGFLLIVSLTVSAALAAAGDWWGGGLGWPIVVGAVNFVISLATYTVAFAMLFKFLPRVEIRWHDVWIGALLTAILFQIGKFVIGLYLGINVTEAFGAAGSLVVLLIWLYYSAQIFLFGAEFTAVYAHRRGARG